MTYRNGIIALCVILIVLIGVLCLVILYKRKDSDDLADQLDRVEYECKSLKDENDKLKIMVLQTEDVGEDGVPHSGGRILFGEEDSTFEQSLEDMPKINLHYYERIAGFTKTLEGVTLIRRARYERLCYGSRKTIALFSVRKGRLVVKTNIGYLTIQQGDNERRIEIKPITVPVVDEESFTRAKNNIRDSYERILSISKEAKKNVQASDNEDDIEDGEEE